MRANRLIFSIGILFLILISCSSFKHNFKKEKGINSAIQNAIIDFSKKSNIYKKGVVFSVSTHELENNNDLFVIRIAENNAKMLMKKEAVIGSKGKLASQYLKDDNGKLFFWWDDSHPLEQETIDIFKEYNILANNELDVLDIEIDDSKKAVHYYFCKNGSPSNYKKVTTNKGIGYYHVPKTNCQ